MASRQQIKQRIGSVKNTKQITRVMQLVAASKLKRAQDAAAGPTAYARLARQILARLRQVAKDEGEGGLFTERPLKNRLLIVIASDLGLAGAYDGNVIRRMIDEVKADRDKGINTQVITIGRKAGHAAAVIKDVTVEATYHEIGDKPSADSIRLHTTANLSQFLRDSSLTCIVKLKCKVVNQL